MTSIVIRGTGAGGAAVAAAAPIGSRKTATRRVIRSAGRSEMEVGAKHMREGIGEKERRLQCKCM
jgi:hypothetical protein